jgi:hypothetical protein
MTETHLDIRKITPIQWLRTADPDIAREVAHHLAGRTDLLSSAIGIRLVDEIVWSLAREESFGHATAKGGARLLIDGHQGELETYLDWVHEAGLVGATRGRLLAEHLVAVLLSHREELIAYFPRVLKIMLAKGAYTLKAPLEALTRLLETADNDAAYAFLELLAATYRQNLTYNRCLHLTYLLPKAVLAFGTAGRYDRIRQLTRVMTVAHNLADALIIGMERGLTLLKADYLDRFVAFGLKRFEENQVLGRKFLSLESKLGLDTCQEMQVTVLLTQVKSSLGRYIKVRTGLPIAVRPLTGLPKTLRNQGFIKKAWVLSDSRTIYLPAEIGRFDNHTENRDLFKILTKLEAGLFEFGTHEFDLQKALDLLERQSPPAMPGFAPDGYADDCESDHEAFFGLFASPPLAEDLFTIFEYGRIRVCLNKRYPGLGKKADGTLLGEVARMEGHSSLRGLLSQLYLRIALGMPESKSIAEQTDPSSIGVIGACMDCFQQVGDSISWLQPEPTALVVFLVYDKIVEYLSANAVERSSPGGHIALKPPFGRRLYPQLNTLAQTDQDRTARAIQASLSRRKIRVYRSEIQQRLKDKEGALEQKDLIALVQNAGYDPNAQRLILNLVWSGIDHLVRPQVARGEANPSESGRVFRYREWDRDLNDYLRGHVRLIERNIPSRRGDFYLRTIERHQGLVKQLRYAFEMLKPQSLKILRRWLEGDEFDYRALLDFALDRRAGLMPSERLYIKRIKQARDVAVLLLVDISRSTANAVAGSSASVLDVEKEAIVLFSEALDVVGDTFAMAGFSGNGRFQVDYFRIKDFTENLGDAIHWRINAMAPQRSTRMGAAVRHATACLHGILAKVKILILLGDGFPNDVDYKNDYAMADTRRAIWEARSRSIHVKAITVNMGTDRRLDNLYGDVHHSIITDVRELPDKLLRVYSSLTRY